MIELHPYQTVAVEKFVTQRSRLCGDEMGTGKTVIALALDNENAHDVGLGVFSSWRTLIVAPLSVHHSWERHLGMMQPGRPIYLINPKKREDFEFSLADKNAHGVFICHYEALRLMDCVVEGKVVIDHAIADEVHKIKNRKAKQTIALKRIKATYKTGLSGTPADNKPEDIWSILHWLKPREWTSYWRFYRKYVLYVTTPEGYNIVIGVNPDTIGELREKIAPYYIRRTKKQVMPDLPDKYYTTVEVDLSPKERKSYEAMKKDMIAWVGEHEEYPVVAPVVLAQLTRLSQFAVAYADVNEAGNVRMHEPSAKLDAVSELIDELAGEQVGIFTNYTQVLDLLQARLERRDISFVRLDGNTPQRNRGNAVLEFQRGDAQCFIGTHGAGGIGIDLYNASRLIRIDRAWSPSLDKQVEDRFHRHGQKNAVQVIDIVARKTIDQYKTRKLIQKWDWIRQVIENPNETT